MGDSIFAGMKLSQPAVAVDQRLFSSSPALEAEPEKPVSKSVLPRPVAEPKAGVKPPPAAVRKAEQEGKRETGKEEIPFKDARQQRPLTDPTERTSSPFDLSEKPYRKDSFLFTDSEFDRLDDLKLELRRRFDLPATKNDIARCALQVLFEDYMRDAEKSRIVRHLRAKQR